MSSENFNHLVGYHFLSQALPLSRHFYLKKLLQVLGVEQTLNRVLPIIKTFRELEELQIINIPPSQLWEPVRGLFHEIQATAEIILQYRFDIQEVFPLLDIRPSDNRNNVYRRQISDGELCATLGFLPEEIHLTPQWQLLISHIIAVHTLTDVLELAEINSVIFKSALKELRNLAESPALENLPTENCSPYEYLEKLEEIKGGKTLSSIRQYLTNALDLCTPRQRDTHTQTMKIDLSLKEDSEEDFNSIVLIEEGFVEAIDENLPPEPNGQIFIFPKVVKGPLQFFLPENLQTLTWARARDNQYLLGAWNNLNQHDLKIIVNTIFNKSFRHDVVTRIQLGFMLFAGMSPSRIGQIGLARNAVGLINGDFYIQDTHSLRLVSHRPVLKKQVTDAQEDQAYPRQFYVDLSLPDELINLIEQYISRLPSGQTARKLFDTSLQQKHLPVISWLRKRNKRITSNRIQTHQIYRIANLQNSDIATASLILGREIYIGRARIHYLGADPDVLREIHTKAVNEILNEAGYKSYLQRSFPGGPSLAVGTPFRPQVKVVSELISRIMVQIKPPRKIATLKGFVNFHNSYCLYTYLYIANCTGYRPKTPPYISEQQIDLKTGLAFIWDKSGTDQYHCRLAWLPADCQRHLQHFRDYISKIYQIYGRELCEQDLPDKYFFFLSDSGQPLQASMGELESLLKSFGYHLPSNSQRHLLKSELQEHGCHWEIIEALLGHWHHGEEPWVYTSALLPQTLIHHLEICLTPLLEKIGFEKIPGPKLIPKKLKIRLPEVNDLETDKKIKHNRCFHKWLKIVAENLPHEIWISFIGSNIQKLQLEELYVLVRILKTFPGLYAGEEGEKISDREIELFIRKLKPKPFDPLAYFKRFDFFIKGLNAGKAKFNWKVTVPPRPVIVKKPHNLARTTLVPLVRKARQLEEILKRDIEDFDVTRHVLEVQIGCSIDQNYKLAHQILRGQILLSAILYSGITNPAWAESLMRALSGRVFHYNGWVWVDLWTIDLEDMTDTQIWRLQKDSNLYRRLLPDPMTRNLILQYCEFKLDNPNDEHLCPNQVFHKYQSYLASKEMILPDLKAVFSVGQARAEISHESFLSTLTRNSCSPSSLPDFAWVRMIADQSLYNEREKGTRRAKLMAVDDQALHDRQMIFLKKLRRIISCQPANKKLSLSALRKALRSEIELLLEKNKNNLCDGTIYLSRWAIQMLSKRVYHKENRKAQPEAQSTVLKYLEAFDDEFILHAARIDFTLLEEDEYVEIIQKISNTIVSSRTNNESFHDQKSNTESILKRLNQFLSYLHLFEELPEVKVNLTSGRANQTKGSVARANFLTISEYKDLRRSLGWKKQGLSRNLRMSLIAAILLYRTGMRVGELEGLTIDDFVGENNLEILVRRNHFRGLKSEAAQRRLPVWVLLSKQELNFLIEWLEFRRAEPGTRGYFALFTAGTLEINPIARDTLTGIVRQAMVEITGDTTLTLHSLRHSFANNILVRLINIPMELLTKSLKEDEFTIEDRLKIQEYLLGVGATPKKALFSLGLLLGHATTETELNYYIHICDLILFFNSQLRINSPQLTTKTIARLTGLSRRSAQELIKKDHPLAGAIPRLQASTFAAISHPLIKKAQQRNQYKITIDQSCPSIEEILVMVVNNLPEGLSPPRTQIDLEILSCLYQRLYNYKLPRPQKVKAINALIRGLKNKNKEIYLEDPGIANLCIKILKNMGLKFSNFEYHAGASQNKEEVIKSLLTWRDKIDQHVTFQNIHTRSNLKFGRMSIGIKYLSIGGFLVEIDVSMKNIIALTLYICSMPNSSKNYKYKY